MAAAVGVTAAATVVVIAAGEVVIAAATEVVAVAATVVVVVVVATAAAMAAVVVVATAAAMAVAAVAAVAAAAMTAVATAASRRVRRAARSNHLSVPAMTMTLRWVTYRTRATVARDDDANPGPWNFRHGRSVLMTVPERPPRSPLWDLGGPILSIRRWAYLNSTYRGRSCTCPLAYVHPGQVQDLPYQSDSPYEDESSGFFERHRV